jgi:hypothetical protein
MENNAILTELLEKQRKNIEYRLNFNDMRRISSKLENSIFGEHCSLWTGTKLKMANSVYISFQFNGKRTPLQRLLYRNFVEDISENEYLAYCKESGGECCTIKHFSKKNTKSHNIETHNSSSKKNVIPDLAKVEASKESHENGKGVSTLGQHLNQNEDSKNANQYVLPCSTNVSFD